MSRRPLVHATSPFARVLALSIVLAACTDRGEQQRAAADSDLARDLALVQSTAAAQPIFRDSALTNAPERRAEGPRSPAPLSSPAPRTTVRREVADARPRRQPVARPRAERPSSSRPTRAAATPPPEPRGATPQPAAPSEVPGASDGGAVGAGAVLAARTDARVCTRTNLPGDRITATLSESVRGVNGAEIPAGSKVVLEVVSIEGAEPPANGQVGVRATSVAIGDASYPASGSGTMSGPLERTPGARSASSDRKKVIGGAIAGAILGQMIGKDTRSTVIGAAAGAAAGTAAAKMGDRGESCLAAGTPIRITLDEAVVLH
jgi:hypothetical protein